MRNIYTAISVLLLVFFLASCSSSNIYAPVYNQHAPSKTVSPTAHIVQTGDTLYSIAWQNGKDYKSLAKWNNISSPYTIYKGQKLTLVATKSTVKKKKKIPTTKNKVLIKQKINNNTSNNYQKGLKLSWQWPIKVQKLEKGRVKSGVVLFGSSKELVRSSERGKVVYAGSGLKGYGNLLIVMHNDEYLTAYGYNKRLLVKEGFFVKKGQAIAEIGVDNKKRSVLFFEMRRHGKPVSVTKYLPKLGK